jgi:hypothetical protein
MALAPRSNRSVAIVCVMARRLVVISCRSRCCMSCSSSSCTWRSSIAWFDAGFIVEAHLSSTVARGQFSGATQGLVVGYVLMTDV